MKQWNFAHAWVFAVAVAICGHCAVPVGSLESFGTTRVAGVSLPGRATIFAGDIIETGAGNAVFTTLHGHRLDIGPRSSIRVGENNIAVLFGLSRVQARTSGLTVAASEWHLEFHPVAPGAAMADVVRRENGDVSLRVLQGEVLARNGGVTRMVPSGRGVLLAAAAPDAQPQPAAAPPPLPQSRRGPGQPSSKDAIAVAVAGAALVATIAVVGSRENPSGAIASMQVMVAQERNNVAAMQVQAGALMGQLNALMASIRAEQQDIEGAAELMARLNAAMDRLRQLQAELAGVQNQISQVLDVLASGRRLSAEQSAQLDQLRARELALGSQINAITQEMLEIQRERERRRRPSPSRP